MRPILLLLTIVVLGLGRVRMVDFMIVARTTELHVSSGLVKCEAHSLNACGVIDKCHVGVVGLGLLAYLQSVYNVWYRFF